MEYAVAYLFGLAFYAVIVAVPVAKILSRVGLSRWGALLALLAFVPVVQIAGLWIFAFMKWPIDEAAEAKRSEWSEADKEAFRRMLSDRRF